MAAYTFRAAGTFAQNNDSSALSPGAPAGKAVGDLLILVTANHGAVAAPPTPSGWTLLSSPASGPSISTFARIADGSATDTPQVDWTGSVDSVAVILAYYGDVFTGDLRALKVSATNATASQAAPILPTLEAPPIIDTMLIAVSAKRKTVTSNDATSHTAPGAFTKRAEVIQAGTAITCVVADLQQTTAATYDGTDFTINGTAEAANTLGHILAIRTVAAVNPTIFPDVATSDLRTDTSSPHTFSHAGAASGVAGVVLSIIHPTSSTDHVSAASYGGVAMARAKRNVDAATEPGAAEIWFVGTGLGAVQGTQTVSYTCGATTDDIFAVCETLICATDLVVRDTDGIDGDTTNPAVTLQAGGQEIMCFGALFSGVNALASITNSTNVTGDGSVDFTSQCATVVRQNASLFVDFTIGLTVAAEDAAYSAIAVTPKAAEAPDVGAIVTLGYEPTLEIVSSGVTSNPDVGAIATLGYAPTMDTGIVPPVGAVVISGLAPDLAHGMPMDVGAIVIGGLAPSVNVGQSISPDVGTITAAGLAPTFDLAISPPVGTITAAGLAPTDDSGFPMSQGVATIAGLAPSMDKGIIPPVGAVTISGLAPTLDISYSFAMDVGALTFASDAPEIFAGTIGQPDPATLTIAGTSATLGFGYPLDVTALTLAGLPPSFTAGAIVAPDVGAAVITGLAPTLGVSIAMSAGALVTAGLAPTRIAGVFGGGGYGGLLVALGLNFEVPNTAPAMIEGTLQITGWAPTWGADYTYGPPQGAVTIAGYAPVVTTAEGNQEPVMDAPVALAITGLAPTVISGKRVTFPFDADTQGFTGTTTATCLMDWIAASGNPGGALSKRVTGNNTTDTHFWSLTSDWASLGIPANSTITGISFSSADSRVSEYANGVSSNVSAVTLIPTGFAPIELSAARAFSAAEAGWTTTAGAGASGLEIPSGGSLTITAGSIIHTGPPPVPPVAVVRLMQDNISFVVSYVAQQVITPDAGSIAATGYAPTVTGLAAEFGNPPAGSLSIQGAGPTVQITAPITGGGGGPGLLAALGLLLEQTPLGNAQLVITGYAPSIFRPIVLSGHDDLISERATAVGTGTLVISSPSTTENPGVATLAIAGLAPTILATESRNFAIPAGTLTFTHFVPSTGIDHVATPPEGTLVFEGQVPSAPPNITATPQVAHLAITGYAPNVLASGTYEPDVGAIAITGYEPELAYSIVIPVPAGALTFAGQDSQVLGAFVWQGSGAFASGVAFASGSGFVTHIGSGLLQSQQPLAFVGTGAHGHTATGTMQSGPASFHGPISPITAALQSARATMLGRGKVKDFKPHKPHKPPKVNRYNVTLKPNKRMRIRNPHRRRPQR